MMSGNNKVNSEFVPEEKKYYKESLDTLKTWKKKTHRSKKKLPGRKQRLRQKLQLQKSQTELAKEQLRLERSVTARTAKGKSVSRCVDIIILIAKRELIAGCTYIYVAIQQPLL